MNRKLCILGLDLSQVVGWCLRRSDGRRDSGVELFKFRRESRGMIGRNFTSWLTKMIIDEHVDLVAYEEPLTHNGSDPTEVLMGMSTKIKELYESTEEAAKASLTGRSPEAWAEIHQAVETLQKYGIPVDLGSIKGSHRFDFVSITVPELKAYARKKLGIQTAKEKREEARANGVAGISKIKFTSDKVPPQKVMTYQLAQVILDRKPKDHNEGDAVCVTEWAIETYDC